MEFIRTDDGEARPVIASPRPWVFAAYVRAPCNFRILMTQRRLLCSHAEHRRSDLRRFYYDMHDGEVANGRAGLLDMIRDADGGLFQVILIDRLHRLSPNPDTLHWILTRLEETGVEIQVVRASG